ncbi:hypothetical protein L2I57_001980 [Tychonema sp. BBK16]
MSFEDRSPAIGNFQSNLKKEEGRRKKEEERNYAQFPIPSLADALFGQFPIPNYQFPIPNF